VRVGVNPTCSLYHYRLLPARNDKPNDKLSQGYFWYNPSNLLVAPDDTLSPGVDGGLGAVCEV
jgi:hypothetical protein